MLCTIACHQVQLNIVHFGAPCPVQNGAQMLGSRAVVGTASGIQRCSLQEKTLSGVVLDTSAALISSEWIQEGAGGGCGGAHTRMQMRMLTRGVASVL
jgi:hypothetical protein